TMRPAQLIRLKYGRYSAMVSYTEGFAGGRYPGGFGRYLGSRCFGFAGSSVTRDWKGFSNWKSYAFLFSHSPRTSYASVSSLKKASAARSGFLSRWYFTASLRNARLISSAEAVRDTPRMS